MRSSSAVASDGGADGADGAAGDGGDVRGGSSHGVGEEVELVFSWICNTAGNASVTRKQE